MTEYINNAPGAPAAIGPYSQAAASGSLLFLSGQIPIDPSTGKLAEGGIENQARQVLNNLSAVLSHSGLNFSRVLKTTIYLVDLGNFKIVNAIYEQAMGNARPARATVQVAALPMGAEIEIEMIASRD